MKESDYSPSSTAAAKAAKAANGQQLACRECQRKVMITNHRTCSQLATTDDTHCTIEDQV